MTQSPARRELTSRLFSQGIPRLWCPLLTHFREARQPDAERIQAHLAALAPDVKGLLVPGSTGEGWEMSDADILGLLAIVLEEAQAAGFRVLIGVLKTEIDAVLESIETTTRWLVERIGATDPLEALQRSHVAGFTVCPPRGRDLSQAQIQGALERVLDLGLPVALYQLPQVTENEMSPETLAALAKRYPHFILFKDTSGRDAVARSGVDLGGVFLVRGAEGNYAGWTRGAGGPYDGFLLSTANVFARELHRVLALLDQGRVTEVRDLSARLERVVDGCFEAVSSFPTGNVFTNANKALDHVRAWGRHALEKEPPLLYSGVRLPREFVETALGLLVENGFFEPTGYMNP